MIETSAIRALSSDSGLRVLAGFAASVAYVWRPLLILYTFCQCQSRLYRGNCSIFEKNALYYLYFLVMTLGQLMNNSQTHLITSLNLLGILFESVSARNLKASHTVSSAALCNLPNTAVAI